MPMLLRGGGGGAADDDDDDYYYYYYYGPTVWVKNTHDNVCYIFIFLFNK